MGNTAQSRAGVEMAHINCDGHFGGKGRRYPPRRGGGDAEMIAWHGDNGAMRRSAVVREYDAHHGHGTSGSVLDSVRKRVESVLVCR